MPGGWSIVSPQFAAALIFLTLGAWRVWAHRHDLTRQQSRTRRRADGLAVLAALLTLATVLTLVNSYFAYLPRFHDVTNVVGEERSWPQFPQVAATASPTAAAEWPRGITTHLAVPDRGSGFGATDALVYLPPQYFTEPAARFPVVYLFHGSPGVPGDWFRGGQAAQTALGLARQGHPVIVVAPRMSHGWLDDPECVDGIHEQVESHLLRDVLPTVDSALRTVADRAGRTFGGMSAGGYCALNLGLRNRGLVSSIIDLSGFTEPTHTGGMRALFGPITPSAQARVTANSPDSYATTMPADPPMRIWLDSGSADAQVVSEMIPIAATLRARGQDVEWRERPGAHTFQVWAPALQEALPWSQGLPPGLASTNPSHPGPTSPGAQRGRR